MVTLCGEGKKDRVAWLAIVYGCGKVVRVAIVLCLLGFDSPLCHHFYILDPYIH